MADPSEYTFCRYTPITTEVRVGRRVRFLLGQLVCLGAGNGQQLAADCLACSARRNASPQPLPSAPQDARDFGSDGYSLRVQHRFSRHIKLLICVTLYNEDQETLGKTLLGICEVRARIALPRARPLVEGVQEIGSREVGCVFRGRGLRWAWHLPYRSAQEIPAFHPVSCCRTWRCCTGSMAATATSTAWTGRRWQWPSFRTASRSATRRCWPPAPCRCAGTGEQGQVGGAGMARCGRLPAALPPLPPPCSAASVRLPALPLNYCFALRRTPFALQPCRASTLRTCSRPTRWACPLPCTCSSTPHGERACRTDRHSTQQRRLRRGHSRALALPTHVWQAALPQQSSFTNRPSPPPSPPPAATRSTPAWTATRRCRSCLPARPPIGASWTRIAGSSTASPTCCSQTSACCSMRVGRMGRRGRRAKRAG